MSTPLYGITLSDVPFVTGYSLCFGLMGALAVQAYIYFTRFADDRKAIKALVIVVLLMETLTTASVFVAFALGFPDGAAIIGPISGVEVTTLTHGFYCWRISSLRKSYLVPFPIMMLSLLQLASIIYFSLTTGLFPSVPNYSSSQIQVSSQLSPWLVIWLGSSVACDLAITICMILILHPSQSHFSNNKSTLVKLTRLTIETGLVTTVAALLELILGVHFDQQTYHVAVFFALSKLYANCLLATLNFRLVLRSKSDPNLTTIVWDEQVSNAQSSRLGSRPSHVAQIVARVETDADVVIDLNETGPGKNGSIEDQTCETYELLDGSAQV